MSKILSQWEIDTLLSAVGETDSASPASDDLTAERTIKLYDFRRPDKFSKDHIRALQNVHISFARLASSSLSSYLRTPVSLTLTSVEQVVYDEYIHQLPSPTVVHLAELQPLVGRIIIEIGLDLTLGMLDRMMGGPGTVPNRRSDLTDIELALFRRLGELIVEGLGDAWNTVADLQPQLVETTLSPEFVQAALPGDIAALLVLEIQALGQNGTISVCIPHPVIEPIMDRLSTQLWFASSSKKRLDDDERARVEESLQQVALPVTAELGSTGISLRELISLTEGDVIRLDRAAEANLAVLVNGVPRFWARPGTLAGNHAVRVTGVIDRETDD